MQRTNSAIPPGGIEQRIGLFGGTFDPVHNGHLIIAETIRDRCKLDKIFFIPANIHPLKDNQTIQSARHRLKMLRLAVADNPHFAVSDFELNRPEVSYSIDTVRHFRTQFPPPAHALFFLLGADNVNQFHRWKSPDELVQLCRFIAFRRPGFRVAAEARPYLPHFEFVDAPLLEISATTIREQVKQGFSIRYLVPPTVENYIHAKALYTI